MGDRPESSEDLLADILGNQQGEQSSLRALTHSLSPTSSLAHLQRLWGGVQPSCTATLPPY
jgi:hypothetical protein